jgi:hypothetical protein
MPLGFGSSSSWVGLSEVVSAWEGRAPAQYRRRVVASGCHRRVCLSAVLKSGVALEVAWPDACQSHNLVLSPFDRPTDSGHRLRKTRGGTGHLRRSRLKRGRIGRGVRWRRVAAAVRRFLVCPSPGACSAFAGVAEQRRHRVPRDQRTEQAWEVR